MMAHILVKVAMPVRTLLKLLARLMIVVGCMVSTMTSAQANEPSCSGGTCQLPQQTASSQPCPECSQRVMVVPTPSSQCAKEVARIRYHAPCDVCGGFNVTVREDDRYLGPPCNKLKN